MVPVDHDPFAAPPAGGNLVPVDHDPFAAEQQAPKVPKGWARVGANAKQVGLGALNTISELPGMMPGIGPIAQHTVVPINKKIYEYLGIHPSQHEPQNLEQKISRGVGENLPGAFVPGAAAPSFLRTAGNMAVQAAAGTTGVLAEEAAPERFKKAAKFAGNIIGGYGAGKPLTAIENAALTTRTNQAPSLSEIKAASQAGYKHPEVAAVQIRPQAINDLASKIEATLVNEGFRPSTNNALGTFRELRRMQAGTAPVSVSDLDAVRRAFGKYAKNIDAAGQPTTEAAAAKLAIDHINDFLPNLKAPDLLAGNATRSNNILQNARRDWAAYKRGSLVDTLEENAAKQAGSSYFGGNLNNSIRQAFRPYGKNNHSKIPGWTDESKMALDRVVSGGPSYSYANLTRNFGRLSPDSKLGIFGHLAAAGYTGGNSVPIAVAGYVAKKMGIAATRSNVENLRDILARESALHQATARSPAPQVSTWPHTIRAGVAAGLNSENPYAP